jgi:hypothetical protein
VPGSASFSPPPQPLDGAAAALFVARYDRTRSGRDAFAVLPNVLVRRVRKQLGAVPSSAQFSYALDSATPDSDFPAWPEQLWPLGATSPYAVAVGDELVVFAADEDGNVAVLFDGFAEAPQVDLRPDGQAVTFVARGVAVRCWDEPVGGALMRAADDYYNADGADTPTDVLVRFNPLGQPNATPEGSDSGADPLPYPVFLDERLARSPDVRREWTLGMMARYLLANRPVLDLLYVDNPSDDVLRLLDDMLRSIHPKGGDAGTIDLANAATYTAVDIPCDDVLASDLPWPEVVGKTIAAYGFGLRFLTGQEDAEDSGELPTPTNELGFVRKDGLYGPPPKALYLQDGGELDPGKTNVAAIRLVRDTTRVKNAARVKARLDRYEVTLVLAPGFPIAPADGASASSIKAFDRSDPSFARVNHDKYRLYVFDETGEGHWDWATRGLTSGLGTDLSAVFGGPDPGGTPAYAVRRRVPFRDLFSLDPNLKPLEATLAISTDYAGDVPGVWDGTGNWQHATAGWQLTPDRIGVYVTEANPNGWNIGFPTASGKPYPAGEVKGVEDQANPGAKHFHLRLTCVIEGDASIDAEAARRTASPVPFDVWSVQDYREVLRRDFIDTSSEFYVGQDTQWDDTQAAKSHAWAIRREQECPPVSAQVEIPWLSLAYEVGDRVAGVDGRGLDLRASSGGEQGETPAYPMVTAVEWDFADGQRTRLELSDPGDEPA